MTEEEMKAEITRLSEELSTLSANSSKLVKEKRDALSRAEKAELAAQEAAEAATNTTSTELEKAIKRAEKAEKAVAEADKRAADLQTTIRNKNADNAISGLLASANVDSRDAGILSRALRSQVEFSDDGEPTIEGKTVADYGKEFFGQKGQGYHYVRAANNGGGSATGNDNSKQPRMTKDNWNNSTWAMIALDNKEEAKAIAIAAGKPELAATL